MKKYYAEREQGLNPIEFPILRSSFLLIYKNFFYDNYFAKECFLWVDSEIELYLLGKIGIGNIWPVEQKIETYDEATLFSVIEFFYDYVSSRVKNGYFVDDKDAQDGYRNLLNGLLRLYNGGYELSEDGEIQRLPPSGFEPLIEETVETNDPDNIDSRIKSAISMFSHYNSSIEDKDAAIIKLSGVLEYLQKRAVKLPEKDDGELFHIMNGFNLRHKNRKQHTDYSKEVWYDWIFYTFLASIHVLLKLNDKKFDLKISHTG